MSVFWVGEEGIAVGLSRGASRWVAWETNSEGLVRGAGWAFVVGQSRVKPPGADLFGVTR